MTNLKSLVALFAAIPLCLPAFTSAMASDIEDHYRAQFKMRVCGTEVVLTEDEEANVELNADEEVIDINLSSEEIGDIFAALEADYNSDPDAFCQ